jgi:hypothetical protein
MSGHEPGPDPMPTDTPLLEVLGRFDAMGYQGQARAVADGAIECLTCRELIQAADVDASRVVRLEGVSDPADMLLVVPIDCPHCDTLSTLVANYGPESTVEEAEVLVALAR